ncbi:MAG: hypothetical protein ACRCXR_00575 [Weissella cibaria]
MAIAGVKPVKIDYLDDDVFIENAWDEPEAEIHSGFPMTFVGYDETRVREILIKFTKVTRGSTVDAELIVDEFMEGGEEE